MRGKRISMHSIYCREGGEIEKNLQLNVLRGQEATTTRLDDLFKEGKKKNETTSVSQEGKERGETTTGGNDHVGFGVAQSDRRRGIQNEKGEESYFLNKTQTLVRKSEGLYY